MATSAVLKIILGQAYGNPSDVDDEVVEVILTPGPSSSAVEVFLDFISYSSGPLPEDILPLFDPTRCPVAHSVGRK
jgi:hypothetical protein